VRLAQTHKHFKAISSRPLLLHGVATQTKHAGQTRLIITRTHAKQSAIPSRSDQSGGLPGFTESHCGAVDGCPAVAGDSRPRIREIYARNWRSVRLAKSPAGQTLTGSSAFSRIIDPRLRARCLAGQRTEAAIGVAVLNRMLQPGRPKSVRNMEKFHNTWIKCIIPPCCYKCNNAQWLNCQCHVNDVPDVA
jgi:hypothetical protein